MTVASFIASQRTEHRVPHAVSCRALEVSESWLYKWLNHAVTEVEVRRQRLDEAVRASFEASGAAMGRPGCEPT